MIIPGRLPKLERERRVRGTAAWSLITVISEAASTRKIDDG